MKKLISSLHKIFEESPRHCADYKNITESNDKEIPMLFVSHRCVENVPVAQKAREIWLKILEIVKYWKSLPKRKQPWYGKVVKNTSYDHLLTFINGLLISVKIMFFENVARKLSKFLTLFKLISLWLCFSQRQMVLSDFSWKPLSWKKSWIKLILLFLSQKLI